jgi:hypothetical protein
MKRILPALILILILVTCLSGCKAMAEKKRIAELPRTSHSGRLLFEEIPETKNPRAWTGNEFYLVLDDPSQSISLQPSEAVPRDVLIAWDSKDVTVTGYMNDPEIVDVSGMEENSYPVDSDGNPLPKGGGFVVEIIVDRE